MKKRPLTAAALSLTLALGIAGPAAAQEVDLPPLPPARTSEQASCVGALSTILAQVKFRSEVNEQQQGEFVRELAKIKGTTPAECFGPQG